MKNLSTTIHEIFHVLFFNPALFDLYPTNADGESFMFFDTSDGIKKLRGDNILNEMRNHFKCFSVKGGKFTFFF
jgi:hypothetical protein